MQEQYITKDHAAQILNLSPRRVLELAERGNITKKESYNPQTGRTQTVLSADDVNRMAADRKPKSIMRQTAAMPPAGASMPPQAAALPQFSSHQWLTVEESARYLRLPVSTILHAIGNGKLHHLDVGPRPGGRFRLKCSDLDQFR